MWEREERRYLHWGLFLRVLNRVRWDVTSWPVSITRESRFPLLPEFRANTMLVCSSELSVCSSQSLLPYPWSMIHLSASHHSEDGYVHRLRPAPWPRPYVRWSRGDQGDSLHQQAYLAPHSAVHTASKPYHCQERARLYIAFPPSSFTCPTPPSPNTFRPLPFPTLP